MATVASNLIPADLMAQLQEACEHALSGMRNRAEMKRAAERMDQLGEQVRAAYGVLDIGVPAIRSLRDDEGE